MLYSHRKRGGSSKGLWLRLYTSIIKSTDKSQRLNDRQFRRWILTLAAYKDAGGMMPPVAALAVLYRCGEDSAQRSVDELVSAGLLDQNGDTIAPHDWDEIQFESDTSAERTKRWRDRHKALQCDVTCDVTVTPSETETETETEETPPSPSFAFDAEAAFERIWSAYPAKGRTRRPLCEQVFSQLIVLSDDPATLVESMTAPLLPGGKWIESKSWSRGFVFALADYLTQKRWLEEPEQKGEWD